MNECQANIKVMADLLREIYLALENEQDQWRRMMPIAKLKTMVEILEEKGNETSFPQPKACEELRHALNGLRKKK